MTGNNSQKTPSLKTRITGILPVSLLIVLNLFLFSPATIYRGNIAEFQVAFPAILQLYAIPALVVLSILVGTGLLLPGRCHSRYVALLFAAGVLIWIQGNILVWEYGLFNGEGIEWSKDAWRGWLDIAVWSICLALAFYFHRQFLKIASFASIVLIVLQTSLLAVSTVKEPRMLRSEISQSHTLPEAMFEFSSQKNVIHVVLDGFQSDIFHEIINEAPDHYGMALSGFTYFMETTGSFPTTYMSVPAFLGGEVYRNDRPMRDFSKEVLSSNTILNTAFDNGYDVDQLLTLDLTKTGRYTNAYVIPIPYGFAANEYERASAALMADLVLFRNIPHFLKKHVYNDEAWLVQPFLGKDTLSGFRYFAHDSFLKDLVGKSVVKRDRPVYKYIHLATTHPPVVVGENCKYSGRVMPLTRENVLAQDKCALEHFMGFLEKLKEIGIYDSSLILIHADHGIGMPVAMTGKGKEAGRTGSVSSLYNVAGSAMPLLLVKPPHRQGPMKLSGVKAMLTDIPATVNKLLNLKGKFKGRSVFALAENEGRQRQFYSYIFKEEDWQADFLSNINEYLIDGSVYDADSWRLGGYAASPGISFSTRVVNFGSAQADRHLRVGWGNHESDPAGRTFNWAMGRSAAILISLPKEAIQLTANVISPGFSDGGQVVDVLLDGEKIGRWRVPASTEWQKQSVVLAADRNRPKVSEISFRFSKILKATEQHNEKRPLALRFESLTLEDIAPERVPGWVPAIRFGKGGNAFQYQGKGWSVPEDGFTWTEGKLTVLDIPVPETVDRDIILKVNVRALLLSGRVDSQKIYISVNNKQMPSWTISENAFQEKSLVVPKEMLKDGRLELTFRVPHAVSPAALGISGDKRVLGLAFQAITLTK